LIFKSIKIIIEISNVISDIRDSLNEPAIRRNIENVVQNIQYVQNAAKSIQNAIIILEGTGVFREVRDLIVYNKKNCELRSESQNLKGITNTIRALSLSVRGLLRELKSYNGEPRC
jgi:hypothetical protein